MKCKANVRMPNNGRLTASSSNSNDDDNDDDDVAQPKKPVDFLLIFS